MYLWTAGASVSLELKKRLNKHKVILQVTFLLRKVSKMDCSRDGKYLTLGAVIRKSGKKSFLFMMKSSPGVQSPFVNCSVESTWCWNI